LARRVNVLARRETVPDEPLVSVLTPFHNTVTYLSECIESVLAQTYSNFEYLLVDNKSTDGSREVADRYAALDSRITVLENEEFLDQLRNFNGAVARINPASKYCKLVLGDDGLFPECLRMMVTASERDPRIGLVSSYYLDGDRVSGHGISRTESRVTGRDACRRMLRHQYHFVGSPSAVLYRADIVRSRVPFFSPDRYHADTEAAYEILLGHDLGFIHQVLSFMRADNASISSTRRRFYPYLLDRLIVVERYGPAVLNDQELRTVRSVARRNYFNYLARSLLVRHDRAFWQYHRVGLATIGWRLRRRDLLPRTIAEIVRFALNPQRTSARCIVALRARIRFPASRSVDSRLRSAG
jgi:glycosyltransferase involved in cell wall biosynthesis